MRHFIWRPLRLLAGTSGGTFHIEVVAAPSNDTHFQRVSLQLQVSSETAKPQSSEASNAVSAFFPSVIKLL